MVLDLKPLFEGVIEQIDVDTTVDLSTEEIGGQIIFPEPVQVVGKVFARAGIISLAYSVCAKVKTQCDLCLTPVEEKFKKEFTHTLVLEDNEESPVSYVYCPNGFLALSELVLSDVFLTLPIRFVCKSDCRGLCDRCGKNLNEGSCDCPTKEIDPRLLALQKLLTKDDE